ncbi:MAG: tRNA threonylcarbamoyladenosine dehydratase [Sulfurimicrobium sp.]|nr:tRNA threonylcarbamoyladenosine dehydratase [Sulfurimicrobium sp.]MDO9188931.1 tRNA threonylcarbamoyladenosine dehydratase [Sulfurimicrobium sp.]MDP1703894.1 tRNA threonylcarbamoyladenosine dehydratase [Sulfurimicrobium sp.]MDP2197118.1 tRNA threonylcarbamoyladenosine dehydratase [Sulfurimicrobium sp.]MDP3687168.1 tRNA threonylcarbamoyladenosine dehydratase [Sulfurimicrobium sp.]
MNGLLPQFERTHILLGDSGLAKLAQKHVFVAGLGGVGSYCAEALARGGVGRLTLLDHDVVAVSNINRQLQALLSTVGQPKVELMRARIMDINPDCQLEVMRTFLNTENVNELVPDCDYVVDAIDSLACKVALVGESVKRGLRVASSMGAGNRLDPGKIKLADISKTEMCPLAKQMRKRLNRHYDLRKGVLTVFSDEQPRAPLPPQPVDGPGRARAVNGTISYMPPLYGLMLAGAVIKALLES